ncbi:hypothetical protein AcV7_000170 [Taiwanofungus camphoratus]|nr:hypothetical protein AcV7_000170 [Antrodia cinnamomea]
MSILSTSRAWAAEAGTQIQPRSCCEEASAGLVGHRNTATTLGEADHRWARVGRDQEAWSDVSDVSDLGRTADGPTEKPASTFSLFLARSLSDLSLLAFPLSFVATTKATTHAFPASELLPNTEPNNANADADADAAVPPPPRRERADDFAAAIHARFARAHSALATAGLSPASMPPSGPAPFLPRPPPLTTSFSLPAHAHAHAGTGTGTPVSLSPPAALSPPSATSPSLAHAHSLPPSAFTALTPADLPAVLADPHALLLDTRPPTAFAAARLPHALSLAVPSTLLKRPAFALARLAPMLPSPAARTRFASWHTASRIVVYDADAQALAERPALVGLLRKFRAEGFADDKDVAWLRGGLNSVWRDHPELLDCEALVEEDEEDEGSAPEIAPSVSAPGGSAAASGAKALRTKRLPLSAFTSASTMAPPRTPVARADGTVLPASARLDAFTPASASAHMETIQPTPGPSLRPSSLAGRPTSLTHPGAATEDTFTLRLPPLTRGHTGAPGDPAGGTAAQVVSQLTLAQPRQGGYAGFGHGQDGHPFPALAGASSMPTLSLSASPGASAYASPVLARGGPVPMHHSLPYTKPVAFNPFFDAIRQNLELGRGADASGEGARGAGIALRLPRRVRRRVGDLPFEWLREIARKSGRAKESASGSDEEDEDSGSDRLRERITKRERAHAHKGRGQGRGHAHGPHGHHGLQQGHARTHAHAHGHKPEEARAVHHDSAHAPAQKAAHPPTHLAPPSVSSKYSHRSTSPPPSPPLSPAPHPSPGTRAKPLAAPDSPDSSPPGEASSGSHSPPSAEDLTRALELQFYRIELGEQRRLMGVMEHHSMESGLGATSGVGVAAAAKSSEAQQGAGVNARAGGEQGKGRAGKERESVRENVKEAVFPFSITAGLEKGNKNRYRNIWPFEHARVRLLKAHPEDDDYMNASYVQPLGTTKRYIATQGPLPATFNDFWTLCWEQNVHVIVMLTREIEGATVKCGKYWAEGSYGPLRLRLLTTNDTPERERRRRESEMNGGFFGAHVAPVKQKHRAKARHAKVKLKDRDRDKDRNAAESEDESDPDTIRRVFELTHTGYPDAPPRAVTQLQYLDWPDFNVPEDPRGVLGLIREVEEIVAQTRREGDKRWGEGPLRPSPRPTNLDVPQTPQASINTRDPQYPRTVVEGVQGENNDVEPTSGIARHALGTAPVLLHCSAGVGRTGGFIAVDAVLDGLRREMRERKESQTPAAAAASSSVAGSGSRSRSSPGTRSRASSSRGDAMEVDPSPSPPSSGGGVRASTVPDVPGLLVPVSAGESEVHVRVAGFAETAPMKIDDSKEAPMNAKAQPPTLKGAAIFTTAKGLPRTVLPASPELVDEVRRATLHRWSSATTTGTFATTPGVPTPDIVVSSRDSESSSDSYVAPSGSHSGTGSGSRSAESTSIARSRSYSSASPPSSQSGSSSNLSSAMANRTAGMLLRTSQSPPQGLAADGTTSLDAEARTRTFSLPSPSSKDTKLADDSGTRKPDTTNSSRLAMWRSEVRTSSSPPRENNRSSKSPEATDNAGAEAAERDVTPEQPERGRTFDYAQPRRLHEDTSPPLLSTYDEPIRRVVEDMREQRMSLCQSLRQYVFVHRAVIEGALMIVDEERQREKEAAGGPAVRGGGEVEMGREGGHAAAKDKKLAVLEIDAKNVGVERGLTDNMLSSGLGRSLGRPLVFSEKEVSRKRSLSDLMRDNTNIDVTPLPVSSLSPGGTKRGASPTELQKESKLGEVMLTKRPSVKRKPRSEDDTPVEFEPMLLSSPSGSR